MRALDLDRAFPHRGGPRSTTRAPTLHASLGRTSLAGILHLTIAMASPGDAPQQAAPPPDMPADQELDGAQKPVKRSWR